MRVYTVHERAWSAAEDRDAVLLREGFCWPAAVFSVLWALSHGMWRASLGLLALELALAGVLTVAGPEDPFAPLLFIAARLLVGWWGNDWRRAALARDGYLFSAIIAAPNRASAEYRTLSEGAGRSASAYE